MKTMIHLLGTSVPIEYMEVSNCYVKGGMYCVLQIEGGYRVVHKYPLINIFRVIESYREHDWTGPDTRRGNTHQKEDHKP